MVAALFVLLGILYHPWQAYYEFLCHTIDAIQVFAFNTYLFFRTILLHMYCPYSWDLGRLGSLQLS